MLTIIKDDIPTAESWTIEPTTATNRLVMPLLEQVRFKQLSGQYQQKLSV